MTVAPQPKQYDRSGVFNPHTGKKSRGAKERSDFTDLQVKAKADREKKELREHFSKRNPTGLCVRKNTNGSIIRPGGTPAYIG